MPLLTQYQTLFERDSDMQEVLGCMFRDIFDFHLRALRFFQARKWKQLFKAHIFRSKFADIIEDLRQHKELVERQADLIEFREARQARIDAQQRYEDSEAHERARRRLFLRDWLDAPNMADLQEKGQTTREARPQSGCWLLFRDKVKAWLDPSMSVAAGLWIHGIPGAGKTILASLLIETCKTIPQTRTIYATLVMDNLLHQLDLAAVRAELEPDVFPNGLEQAYVLGRRRLIMNCVDFS